ncbi:hypothetical protein BGI51_11470 [Pseudomonas oryzihabitans]|nr:hypothetical protein BGI51_11470 [Pseudomonas psychrotolerans]
MELLLVESVLPGPHGRGRQGLRLAGVQCAVLSGEGEGHSANSIFADVGHSPVVGDDFLLIWSKGNFFQRLALPGQHVKHVDACCSDGLQVYGIRIPFSLLVLSLRVSIHAAQLT